MKNVRRLTTYLLISWALACTCLLQGCFSGTGFEKRATLVPDSVGLSYTREWYSEPSNSYFRGFSIGATWNLK